MTTKLIVDRTEPRLVARFVGDEFEEALAREHVAELTKDIEDVSELLMDLRELTGATILARKALVEFQMSLKAHDLRTAYICSIPRIRGMCMIIVHSADDDRAKVVMSVDEAEHWLTSTALRKDVRTNELVAAGVRLKAFRKSGGAK